MDNEFPLESRTGTTSVLGKLHGELPKQRISLDTLEVLQRKAAAADMTLAEYVRAVLDINAFGEAHMASLAAERIRRVVGTGVSRG
jgi:NAD(P)-dependent dehydrogenase (short-subunit alcohol dehydrogenase family)